MGGSAGRAPTAEQCDPASDGGKCDPGEARDMSVLTAAGIAVLVAVNTAITVVATRFFRLQLSTTWAAAIYTLVFVPMALAVATVVLSGVVGLGGATGSRAVALLLAIVLPLATGIAIDVFWMPAPEEVELPETT